MAHFLDKTKNYYVDFANSIYPRLCGACAKPLVKNEKEICLRCYTHLPQTHLHVIKDNLVEKIFWGRMPVVQATAFLWSRKGSKTQHLMHHIKYKQHPETAKAVGEWMGRTMLESNYFSTIDAIVPVPLHAEKLAERGFNQSEAFGMGLAKALNKPLIGNAISKIQKTESQTGKTRLERIDNTEDVFVLNDTSEIKNKHILLVDDTITTGSTLEACAIQLLKVNTKISIATMAMASR